MDDYQQRVMDEQIALHKKLDALSAFLNTSFIFDALSFENKEDLRVQFFYMKGYDRILRRRIEKFTK